jgi:hypothetical protein
MNGQPIPGYFWDAEKKKYFRIQNQTAAQGSNLKYSSANIKKTERKERIQNVALARSNKVKKERVVRRNPNSFAQTNIDRETGIRRRSRYVHGLWPDACAAGIDSRPEEVLPSCQLRLFDKDPVSHTIYTVHGSNSVCRQPAYIKQVQRNSYNPPTTPKLGNLVSSLRDTYSHYPRDEVTRTTSTVSSLCYLPATGALAVTTYGSDRPPEVWLSDPGRDDPVSKTSCQKSHTSSLLEGERPCFML